MNGEFITNTNVDLNGLPTDSRGFEDDDHIILFYDYVPKTKELVPKIVNKNKNKKHKKGRK